MNETLPALLQRRFGVRARVTLAVAAAVVVAAVAAGLVLHDPDHGLREFSHDGRPAFTLLAAPSAHAVRPRAGELLRLHARRARQTVDVSVRALRLPPYRGAASGILPVYATRADSTGEGRDVLHGGAPAYVIHEPADAPAGLQREVTTMYAVPRDGARDGVVVTLDQVKPADGLRPGGRAFAKAMKSALRSFEFG